MYCKKSAFQCASKGRPFPVINCRHYFGEKQNKLLCSVLTENYTTKPISVEWFSLQYTTYSIKSRSKRNIIISTLKDTFQESEWLCVTFKKASHRHDVRRTKRGCLFIKRIPRHDWWGISKFVSCGLSADGANFQQGIMKIGAKSIFRLLFGPVVRYFFPVFFVAFSGSKTNLTSLFFRSLLSEFNPWNTS